MTGYPARTWGLAMALFTALSQSAVAASVAPLAEPAVPTPTVPNWQVAKTFEQLGHASDSLLLGVRNSEHIEFGLRRDRLATDAACNWTTRLRQPCCRTCRTCASTSMTS